MSKIKSWIKNHKKITVAVLTVLIAFLLLNCVWAVYHNMVFGGYERITRDDNFPGVAISEKDGKTYSVSTKYYLSFGGNLCINDDENRCFLCAWLYLNKEPKIQISVASRGFDVDSEGKLVGSYDDIAKKIYDENYESIMTIMNDYNEWTKAAENKDETYFSEKTKPKS